MIENGRATEVLWNVGVPAGIRTRVTAVKVIRPLVTYRNYQHGWRTLAQLDTGRNPNRTLIEPTRRQLKWDDSFSSPAGAQERAALIETWAALTQSFVGNAREAKLHAKAALDLARNREVEFGAGFALALTGETARPRSLANDLEESFPEDTSVKSHYLPAVSGLVAVNKGQSAKAIELLQAATRYELGLPRSGLNGFFGALYAVFVRGQAYFEAGQGVEAVTAFQKILSDSEIVIGDPIGAVARLQLGRAFALSGDKTRAKAAYQDLLNLWKDADPGIAVLKQAEAEFAKVNKLQ